MPRTRTMTDARFVRLAISAGLSKMRCLAEGGSPEFSNGQDSLPKRAEEHLRRANSLLTQANLLLTQANLLLTQANLLRTEANLLRTEADLLRAEAEVRTSD